MVLVQLVAGRAKSAQRLELIDVDFTLPPSCRGGGAGEK